MGNNKHLLKEVCIIRLMLIVLLVLYHAFAPFVGTWRALPGQDDMAVPYAWVGMAAYSIMLESFTFVSGYIFGFQVYKKGQHILGLKNIIIKKFKRLIVPSLIFGTIYLLIFIPQTFNNPLDTGMKLLEGVGHMWYLPMLFWCFISVCLIEKLKLKPSVAAGTLVAMSVISFLPLPLKLGEAMYYMFFFFIGYVIRRYNIEMRQYERMSVISTVFFFYCIIFVMFKTLSIAFVNTPPHLVDNVLVNKLLVLIMIKIMKLIYSSIGVIFLFVTALYVVDHLKIGLSPVTIRLSTYCFGIYIYQQFILQWIYYHTDILDFLSISLLPWCAFIITICLSILLSHLSLKTRIGRHLIG